MRDTGVRVLRRGCRTQLPVHIDCEDLRGDPMGETFSDMGPQLVVRCVRHRIGATPRMGRRLQPYQLWVQVPVGSGRCGGFDCRVLPS